MSDRNGYDLAGGIFGVASLVLGVLAIFFVPFAFAPLGVLCLVIAILFSAKYRGLYQVAAVALAAGVIIGGWIAVVMDNPLY
jgi:hypothetical protein